MGVCRPKGSRGRPQTFVCFHCPLVASAEAKSPCNEKDQHREKNSSPDAGRSRQWARQYASCGESKLGGAPARAQSYWQGRFAACAFVDDFLGIGRPWNCWGVAPNPTRGAASGPCKGGRKWDEVPPLTLFWLPGLVALPLLIDSLRFQALLALV